MHATRIGVAGLGLIGGSVALRLAGVAGITVTGLDPDPVTREQARAAGIEIADDVTALAAASQIVFVAAPPHVTPALVIDALTAGPDVLVCDLASTKQVIAAQVAAGAGAEAARYLPAHPLMGSDRTGFDAARSDLLAGALWAVCPPPGDGSEAAGPQGLDHLIVLSDVLSLFDGRILVCTPGEHDAAVARTSHAPHLIAGATAAALAGEGDRLALASALSGGGFRDFTRIARADHGLWGQVLAQNGDAVRDALDAVIAELEAVRETLDDAASEAVAGLWRRSHVALGEVDRLRWQEPVWEQRTLSWPAWDQLLALGRTGRTVRRLRASGRRAGRRRRDSLRGAPTR